MQFLLTLPPKVKRELDRKTNKRVSMRSVVDAYLREGVKLITANPELRQELVAARVGVPKEAFNVQIEGGLMTRVDRLSAELDLSMTTFAAVAIQAALLQQKTLAVERKGTNRPEAPPADGVYTLAHQRGAVWRKKNRLCVPVAHVYLWLLDEALNLPLSPHERNRMWALRAKTARIQQRCEAIRNIHAVDDAAFFRELAVLLSRT